MQYGLKLLAILFAPVMLVHAITHTPSNLAHEILHTEPYVQRAVEPSFSGQQTVITQTGKPNMIAAMAVAEH